MKLDNLIQSATAGILTTGQIKLLRDLGQISADDAETLRTAVKAYSKNKRDAEKDAAFSDLNGVFNRCGLGGFCRKEADGRVTIAHGGHVATFPKGQTERLTAMVRAILSAIAAKDSEQDSEQDCDEEAPPSLVAVG